MLTSQYQMLDGKSVLVRSSTDDRNPPVGVRGWLHVPTPANVSDAPRVEVILEFPDMFNEPAHERIIPLDDSEVQRLLELQGEGPYEITLADQLDRPSSRPMRVNPGAIQDPHQIGSA